MEQAKKKFDLLSIFKRFKRKDNNDSQKHHLSKKQQIIVYSAVGVFSLFSSESRPAAPSAAAAQSV